MKSGDLVRAIGIFPFSSRKSIKEVILWSSIEEYYSIRRKEIGSIPEAKMALVLETDPGTDTRWAARAGAPRNGFAKIMCNGLVGWTCAHWLEVIP